MTIESSVMHLLGTLIGSYPYTLLDSQTRVKEGV